MNPNNIEDLASFIHESATIDKDNRIIYFGPGHQEEKLLEIPLECLDSVDSTIAITVGLVKEHYNTQHDRDPRIGISDHEGYYNLIEIRDYNNYDRDPPCEVLYGEGDNELVSHETAASATYKLTFNPMHQFGMCESPQDSGYINTGHFNRELDISKQLYLRVNRDTSGEDYYFHYFLVEVY